MKRPRLLDRIAFRVNPAQLEKVNTFCRLTNMSQAELFRSIIDNLKNDDKYALPLLKGQHEDTNQKRPSVHDGGLHY